MDPGVSRSCFRNLVVKIARRCGNVRFGALFEVQISKKKLHAAGSQRCLYNDADLCCLPKSKLFVCVTFSLCFHLFLISRTWLF